MSRKTLDVRHIIFVGASKGGVGKSTCSLLLALALQEQGKKVGWFDADIYGPSAKTLMPPSQTPKIEGKSIIPLEFEGIQTMSLSYLKHDEKSPTIWRGPLASKAVCQLLEETLWKGLDFLIIDLPPGTGDIPLSLAQNFNPSGALLVSTPSALATPDVLKAASFFERTAVPILGILENMSYITCSDCNHTMHPFGKGGGELIAEETKSQLIAKLPMSLESSHTLDTLLTSPLLDELKKGLPLFLENLGRVERKIPSLKT